MNEGTGSGRSKLGSLTSGGFLSLEVRTGRELILIWGNTTGEPLLTTSLFLSD